MKNISTRIFNFTDLLLITIILGLSFSSFFIIFIIEVISLLLFVLIFYKDNFYESCKNNLEKDHLDCADYYFSHAKRYFILNIK